MALKIRRGLEADRMSIVPSEAELIYTTDEKCVYIGDGATTGGISIGSGTGGSVGYATSAGNAGSSSYASTSAIAGTSPYSGTASFSATAGNAGTSGYATSAAGAGTASYATTAAEAGTASLATSANNSGTASFSSSSGNSGTAYYSTSSGNSGSASYASTASIAGTTPYAGTASFASSTGYSGTAIFSSTSGTSDLATSANNAGTASFATSSGESGTAYYATSSGNSGSAAYASTSAISGTSPYSGTSSFATSAGQAGTSVLATSANNSGSASYATTAGIAGTAPYSGTASYATSAGSHNQNTDTIIFPNGLGSPSYDDLYDFMNLTQSEGRLSGGTITAHAGEGSVNISELEGMIHTANTAGSPLIYFKKAAEHGLALINDSINYIIITYSSAGGGTLTYSASATRPADNTHNAFVIGRCWCLGTDVEVLTTGQNIYDQYGRMQDRLLTKYGAMDHASGGVITLNGTLALNVSDGIWYFGNTQITTTGAQPKTFQVWYKTSGNWTESGDLNLFSDVFDGGTATVYSSYQNGANIGSLGANKYGVYWIYMCPEGDLYVALGDSSYNTLGAAQAGTIPSPPPYLNGWGRLIGRVIAKNSTSPLSEVSTVFSNNFTQSTAVDHASLANLTFADSGHTGFLGTGGTAAFATTAFNSGSASYASTSAIAGTAPYSGTSSFATSSGNSGTSSYSTTAGQAGTSVLATSANNSGTSSYSTTAGNAGSAGSATTAANSGTSSYATTAGIAGTANYAGTAFYATSCGNAGGSSGTAEYATSAGNAGTSSYSTTAGIAGSANYAGTSVLATSANNSGTASYATTASIAGTAPYSGTASFATSSGQSGTSVFATSSGNSGTSYYSTSSGNSGTASYATSSGQSGTAVKATSAGEAGSAGSATTAANSGTASYATSSGQSGTSVKATSAGNAGSAGSATTAAGAGTASYATTAGVSGSAAGAGTASYATTSGIAGSANYAGTALYATSCGTGGGSGSSGTSGTSGTSGYIVGSGYMSKAFMITSPTADADSPVWRVPTEVTITNVSVLCVGGTNIVGHIWIYSTAGSAGSALDSTDITATAGTVASDSTFDNAVVPANYFVGWRTTSVSGTPDRVIVSYTYAGEGSILSEPVYNLKIAVHAEANELDLFAKSSGALPDATNPIKVMIPDGTGYTQRTRAAQYLSGDSRFVMADGTNYWSKGSLADEIKTAYVYAIWDGTGIIWALGGYSGFTRVPASTTATDDDFFLLEANSTYTKAITEYCVCVGKIRYEYNTADAPDHTIQATVLNAPQVIWNPKSDYGKTLKLATTVTQESAITDTSLTATVKQSGYYWLAGHDYGFGETSYSSTQVTIHVNTVHKFAITNSVSGTNTYIGAEVSGGMYLNVGDVVLWEIVVNAGGATRILYGEDNTLGATTASFFRID